MSKNLYERIGDYRIIREQYSTKIDSHTVKYYVEQSKKFLWFKPYWNRYKVAPNMDKLLIDIILH